MPAVGAREMFRNDTRKQKKPLIEKKRRDRINRSLSHLKALLLENIQRNGGIQTAKLDKADILEMTVKCMTMLQYGQSVVTLKAKHLHDYGYQTARFLGDIHNCQNHVNDQAADDILPLPVATCKQQTVQIAIPKTYAFTSAPKQVMPRLNKTLKMEPRITVTGQHAVVSALQKVDEHGESFQDKIVADGVSSSRLYIPVSYDSDHLYWNEHEDRKEELKVWRPW